MFLSYLQFFYCLMSFILTAVYRLIPTVPILSREEGITNIYMKYVLMFMRFEWRIVSTSEFCLLLTADTQTPAVTNYCDIKFHGAYGKTVL